MRQNGAAIRAIRNAQKMSLGELARLIGRTKGHLSKLERELANASDETVNRIAHALQAPPDAITRKE